MGIQKKRNNKKRDIVNNFVANKSFCIPKGKIKEIKKMLPRYSKTIENNNKKVIKTCLFIKR